MIAAHGIEGLVENRSHLTGGGWIFVQSRCDIESAAAILVADYFIAEDPDQEIDMEGTHITFLEFGIFTGVVELEAKAGRTSPEDIANGCLHYLETDNFRD